MATGWSGILFVLLISSILTTLSSCCLSTPESNFSLDSCDTCSALLNHKVLHKWMKLDVILQRFGRLCEATSKHRWRCSVNLPRFYFFLFLLLSGDLETNPGPVGDLTNISNDIDAFKCLPKKGLTIIHLNIRSVKNKVDEIKNILVSNSKKIAIMGLTESWLNDAFTDNLLCVPGYSFLRNDRNISNSHKVKGGGVIAFINKTLSFSRRLDLESSNIEMLALEIRPAKSKPTIVFFVYRAPDDRRNIDEWLTELSTSINSAHSEKKSIVLQGDFNVDILNQRSSECVEFLDTECDLLQLIDEPTHVTDRGKSLIDHVYVSHPDQISQYAVLNYSISDHFPTFATLRLQAPVAHKGGTIRYRCMKNFDKVDFLLDLSTQPWSVCDSFDDPEDCLDIWLKLFTDCVDLHAPWKDKRVKYKMRPDWWTDDLTNAINLRDTINKKQEPLAYRKQRNLVQKLILHAKKDYYRVLLSKGVSSVKQFWNYLRELVPNRTSTCPTQMVFDENIVDDPNGIANGFNQWFTSIVSKYVDDANVNNVHTIETLRNFVNGKGTNLQFTLPELSVEVVEKQLLSLDLKKSAGLDGIHAYFLSTTATVIASGLTGILNKFIRAGKFPSIWKCAKVTPLHKSGPSENPGNFRPISILPILSKIIERHVYDHLTNFLNANDLIYGKQSGFRAFHSCQTALTQLIDCWSKHMAARDLVGVIILDLRKAFDLVDHQILIEKLEIYGIRDNALSFFQDYLSGRSQIVSFNGSLSDKMPVDVGVPQGSILGPLLFLLFVNDLPLITDHTTANMFADDTTFYVAAKSTETLESVLNSELVKISEWCLQNKMCHNAEKTKCMLVTTKQKRNMLIKNELDVYLDDAQLENVSSDKLLGVIVQNDLMWSEHVHGVCSKIKCKLYLLHRIKAFLPRKARKQFFNSFILPHFDYCLSIWGSCGVKDMKRLDRLFKKSMRLILNTDPFTSEEDMYRELRWFPISYRYKLKMVTLVYKGLNDLTPSYISSLLTYYEPKTCMSLRSVEAKHLEVPFTRSSIHKRAFSINGPKLFNELPLYIRESKSFACFKSASYSYFYNSYLSTIL